MSHPKGLWTSEPQGDIQLKITPDGAASRPPQTVIQVFRETVAKYGDKPALCFKPDKATPWRVWTYKDYMVDVKACAKSFMHVGVLPQHSVCILGFNSPEWFIADLAAIAVGAMATGIYTTNEPEACFYSASHSRAQVIVVENKKQLDKILQIRSRLPELKAIVQYTGTVSEELKQTGVHEWNDFLKLGKDIADYDLQARIDQLQPQHCCTLIYTSGTTGDPKAVMISHDNINFTTHSIMQVLEFSHEEVLISYLPLSHIAAQLVDLHAPIAIGGTVYFAQADALKGSLPDTLREVRPTIFLGVPRVWEKIQEKMVSIGKSSSSFKKFIARWAKEVGLENGYRIQRKQPTSWTFSLADMLVYGKVKAALGLDRCRLACTAAAPISKDTLEFFLSLSIPIYEVYGMSESTGPETVSLPGRHKTGSCGVPFPGAELFIDQPDAEGNGEILMRGRHVFMGYLFNAEKTAEAIDERGYLHTGDIGRVDNDGFLYITGRIKELVITAGGENVAPVPIEDNMKEVMPLISNCMVVGDRKKFNSMLVTLKCDVDSEGVPLNTLNREAIDVLVSIGSDAKTVEQAASDPKVKAYITEGIKKGNTKAVSNAAKIQKFAILPQDFSLPTGELGPTLKLKRPVVAKKYNDVIEALYGGTEE